jgi:hypothetical protein
MMRIIYLYAIFLLVIIFISCSKNDEPPRSFSTYLVKKVIRVEESDSSTTIYTYNNNKLISEETLNQSLHTYEYTDSSVLAKTIMFGDQLDQISLFIFKNGLVVKSIELWPKDGYGELLPTGDTTIYNYDSNNQLIESLHYTNSNLRSKSINTWNSNGNLLKTEDYDYAYQLSSIMNTTYIYYTDKPDVRDYGLSFRGKQSKNLIKTITINLNITPYFTTYSMNYKYTFDKKGRPEKETRTSEHGYYDLLFSY